jgi:hypothetical protein
MKAQTMRSLRLYHHYVGIFFAPMLLLFALSGAVQVFRLNEAGGWGGPPPALLAWMASVHKDQSLPRAASPERAKPLAADREAVHDDHNEDAPKPAGAASGKKKHGGRSMPLEILTVLLGVGLIVSTALGMVIALNNRTMRRTSVILLVLGTIVPLAFLYL